MEYIPTPQMPPTCEGCADRLACLSRGEGEWCCDECDHLLERFIEVLDESSALRFRPLPHPDKNVPGL